MDSHDARPSEPAVTNAIVAAWQVTCGDAAPRAATVPPPSAAAQQSHPTWLCDPSDPDARAIEAFFAAGAGLGAEADQATDALAGAENDAASAPLGPGSRGAMLAALSMFSVSALMIGGFVAYHRLVMPVPVELGVANTHANSGAENQSTSVSAARDPAVVPPPSAAALTPPTFDDLLQVAQSFADEGRDKHALDAYDRALVLRPQAASALAGKAQAHLHLDERAAAKQFAALAVRADPRNGLGWVVLGAVEELLGSHAAAQDAYRQCSDQAEGAYLPECRKLLR